jgi:beta-N-acetylhexosaminidase
LRESIRRAGQRLLVGFPGHEASPDLKTLIRDYGVGGCVLFARNVDTPEQATDLVRELQSLARAARHELPLLVAVDQEGGRVARLKEPWTRWPPLRALGRMGSEDHAARFGSALAEELASCGIRLELAPVVDVLTNPQNPVIGDRSFGDDPALVGRLGAAFIRGLQEGGVAASAKHFPGHGDTAVDSHHDLPLVDHSPSRLQEVELRPFRDAIAAGVATIMTAHILVRELDDRLPSTLSPAVVGGLLRKKLGFEGVVLSDDLEMKAVAARYPPGEAARLAAKAGCDVLLMCSSPEAQVAAVEGLVKALEEGELLWSEMDDASGRIRRLKERFLLPYSDPSPDLARAAAGSPTHLALAQEITAAGGA